MLFIVILSYSISSLLPGGSTSRLLVRGGGVGGVGGGFRVRKNNFLSFDIFAPLPPPLQGKIFLTPRAFLSATFDGGGVNPMPHHGWGGAWFPQLQRGE